MKRLVLFSLCAIITVNSYTYGMDKKKRDPFWNELQKEYCSDYPAELPENILLLLHQLTHKKSLEERNFKTPKIIGLCSNETRETKKVIGNFFAKALNARIHIFDGLFIYHKYLQQREIKKNNLPLLQKLLEQEVDTAISKFVQEKKENTVFLFLNIFPISSGIEKSGDGLVFSENIFRNIIFPKIDTLSEQGSIFSIISMLESTAENRKGLKSYCQEVILLPLPDETQAKKILKHHLKKMHVKPAKRFPSHLKHKLANLPSSDIEKIANKTALIATAKKREEPVKKENVTTFEAKDLESAIHLIVHEGNVREQKKDTERNMHI